MSRILVLGLSVLLLLAPVPIALAAGPTSTNTPPSSVNIVVPGVTPPPLLNSHPSRVTTLQPSNPIVFPPTPSCDGLGTPNTFASAAIAGTSDFRQGVCNPFNNPHPMLPWGDGQIGGERYGQVIRYWEQQAQLVENVILILPVPQEESAAPPEPSEPQGEQPGVQQPGTPQGALQAKAVKEPERQTVTVPGARIVETTRGYIHMPRWVLRELGGGRYEWALVGAWFQPR